MTVRRSWTLAALVASAVLIPLALVAQQRDASPSAPVPVGTGQIAGVLVSAETLHQPIRRAVVTLTGAVPARSVLTDDAGRFSFDKLPAGSFTVIARKAAYLAAPYGARHPGRTGVPIVLTDGQRSDISIAMFRGSAISGVVRDAAGLPMQGVDVRAIDARTLLVAPDNAFELATSDDLGAFRIFSLRPGDYYVVATPTPSGSGEIVAQSTSSIDAALASLTSRQPSGPSPSAPTRQRAVGFSPIYFPGSPNYRDALRVHLDPGQEQSGVNIQLRTVPMAAIEGVVHSSIPNLAPPQITLIPSGPRVTSGMSSNSLSGKPIDAQGAFQFTNLPPGSYRLVARAARGVTSPASPPIPAGSGAARIGGGGGGGPTSSPSTGDYLYGFADIELNGDDVTNVAIDLQLGGSISGKIVFTSSTGAPAPADLSKIRTLVSLEGGMGGVSSGGLMMGTSLLSSPISSVQPDGTFEIRGIGPGRYALSMNLSALTDASAWKLRSAIAGGRNLLDDLLDLGPGTDIRNVVVTFSDARTELSGSLQTAAGALTTDYYIVALPTDRSFWRPKSPRILSVRPGTDGRFVFADLPAGEYLIAALDDLDPLDLFEGSFLEQVAAAGVKVKVTEGQKAVQNLQIR